MASLTLQQAFDLAMQHQQAGRFREAEAVYQQILTASPNHPDALHRMGILFHLSGRNDLAIDWIRRAIAAHPLEIDYQINLGIILRAAGQAGEAEKVLRIAMAMPLKSADSRERLGTALRDLGRFTEAATAYRQAISIQPAHVGAMNQLGLTLGVMGEIEAAIAAFAQALRIQPAFAEAHCNLADVHCKSNRPAEAKAAYQRALALQPHFPRAWNNFGNLLKSQGQLTNAVDAYQKALSQEPASASIVNNLGAALAAQNQHARAMALYQQSIAAEPTYPDAYYNVGVSLQALGQTGPAIDAYRRALAHRPEYPDALNNLGLLLQQRWEYEAAIEMHRSAIRIEPNAAESCNNLGNALKEIGQIEQAIDCFKRGMELAPAAVHIHSNLVYATLFHPDFDARRQLAEARAWAAAHADAFKAEWKPHLNDRSSQRRLRIGYVSADFRDHVIGRNVLPLLEHHNREEFEIHCFSAVDRPDDLTAAFRNAVDGWHDIASMEDAQAADLARELRIDILVDLSLHMAGNRLLMLARRPAPIQVTWAGYPGTTGLSAIDYRLTDPFLDPPERDELYSEKSVRLPHSFWCYRPPEAAPPVNALPAETSGAITFGCLNNFAKVSRLAWELWGEVLKRVPNSRLLALCPEGSHRQDLLQRLAATGVDPARVEFTNRAPRERYFQLYQRIDICLDPLPYTGHSTSLDALWMGVPVVTLAGETAVARGGVTPLSNLGLTHLITESPSEYVTIAAKLAEDYPGLASLRGELRERMRKSPLCDEAGFAKAVEVAYREMWSSKGKLE